MPSGARAGADHLPVYTLGHSTRTVEELLGLLGQHGIELLVDVRRFPGLRRHPHFSKEALTASLAARGLEVRHILGPGQARAHDLSPAARALPDGRLIYPGAPARRHLGRGSGRARSSGSPRRWRS